METRIRCKDDRARFKKKGGKEDGLARSNLYALKIVLVE